MRKCLLALAFVLVGCVPSQAAFTLVGGTQHAVQKTGVAISTPLNAPVTLPVNPTTGNLVLVGVSWFDGVNNVPPSIGVTDGNSNTYTKSANSPSNSVIGAGPVYVYYLLSAPANANKVITVALGTDASAGPVAEVWAMEFHSSVGNVTFDSDVTGTTASAGLTINTPTMTPVHANALIFGVGGDDTGSVSSVNNGSAPNWVCPETLPTTDGTVSAYVLSVSAGSAANWTINASSKWDSIIAAFYEAGAVTCTPTLSLLGVGRCG
jgi:hypothetical protein